MNVSETKHTPGEWKVLSGMHAILPEGPTVEVPVYCVEQEGRQPNQNMVAVLIPNRADADLIAAAPDMQSALESVLELDDCDYSSKDCTYEGNRMYAVNPFVLERIVSAARAALAKANGKE
jgi:hypothetical protein